MPKEKSFNYGPLVGGINSTAEDGSLNSFSDPRQPLAVELRDIENFQPSRRGGLQKVKGFSEFHDLGTGVIRGLAKYRKSTGTNELLAMFDGGLYRVSAGSGTLISSGFSSTNYVDMKMASDYMVICDGTTVPKIYDGSTVANLGGSPPDDARQTLYTQNRLFIFSDTVNPSLVYYSDAGDIQAGYASNFIACDINDGQKITSITNVFIPGQLEPVILVGKESSVGVITGDGTLENPFTYIKINADVGITGFRQTVQYGQNVAYLTRQGVTSYRTDLENVNLRYTFISEKVRDKFTALDSVSIKDAHCWHDYKNRRISWAVPEAGKTTPNVIWHFDTEFMSWYKERYATGQDITAACVDENGDLYHGDSNGKIYLHNEDYNFNDQPINAYFVTDYLDFSASQNKKRIKEAKVTMKGNGSYSVGVSSKLDFGTRNGKNHSLPIDVANYVWGGGVWTSNPSVYQWGSSNVSRKKFYPGGFFDSIQFTFTQSGLDQQADIYEIQFLVEYGDWR